jgi:hypothetical protein
MAFSEDLYQLLKRLIIPKLVSSDGAVCGASSFFYGSLFFFFFFYARKAFLPHFVGCVLRL